MTSTNRIWIRITALVWIISAAVMCIRILVKPHLPACFTSSLLAGTQWRHAEPLYLGPWGGFIYTPIFAAFFSSFTCLPEILAHLVWSLFSIGSLAWGIKIVLTKGPFYVVPQKLRALVFLGILPAALGNLDRGQANPLMLVLFFLAITAAGMEKWNLCVVAVAIATYLKVYPLVVGLLFCIVWPKQITWRLVVALIVLGLLPFAFQNPRYVLQEYQSWIQTRMLDDRLQYSISKAPLDLWYLLVRIGHLPVSPRAYWVLRVMGGLGIALFCLVARRRWDKERILAGIYILSTLWMLLLGPATESATYLLLGPVASIGLIQAFAFPNTSLARTLATSGFVLLLVGVIRDHFIPHAHNAFLFAAKPAAAILLLFYAIEWLRKDAMWPKRCSPILPSRPDSPKLSGT